MELSITIASYNTCDVTGDTLASVFAQTTGIEFEVIVVDNASTDGSAEMIESRFPSVQLIRSDRNLGFAAAHNLALARAKGKYLLVLNSDVLFLDNAAKRMVDDLRVAHESIGVIGPQILNRNGSLAPSSRRRIFYSRTVFGLSMINQFFPFGRLLPMDSMRRYFGRLLGRVHDNFNPPAMPQEVEWLDGMCVMFKREALHGSGLFDEQFFFDYEIGDLLIRMRASGWGILFDPTIKIVHQGFSRRKAPIQPSSHQSQLIYYSKHKPEYVAFIRSMFHILIDLKLRLLKLEWMFSANRKVLWERAQILEKKRKINLDFEPRSVSENTRIPRLLRSGEDGSWDEDRAVKG
jgi:GT2 family glycosyltransferase